MRPAAGAETLGDLERGMAALGRKGELPEHSAGDAIGDDDAIAGLQRDADQAESEALAAAAERDRADVEAGRSAERDSADLPILKRELFSSDSDWFEAQHRRAQNLESPGAQTGGCGLIVGMRAGDENGHGSNSPPQDFGSNGRLHFETSQC